MPTILYQVGHAAEPLSESRDRVLGQDGGRRSETRASAPGLATAEPERLKELERENRELERATGDVTAADDAR